MKLSTSEWAVMEVLWTGERFALHEIEKALQPSLGWSKNTVHTYLSRMAGKGLVCIEKGAHKPYRAGMTREQCAHDARNELLHQVYGGAAGDLIAAFLKETHISNEERDRLRRMLDEMEV